jgi:hypothetical protein
MINETEAMKQARRNLQDLTASDPAVRANMLRHVAALSLMIAGRRARNSLPGEPHVISTFQFAPGERDMCMAVTSRTGLDQVVLAFDIDDAAGPPVGLGVIRIEGEEIVCYGACRLWAPAGDGRALIVPAGDQDHGHFAFQRGGALRHVRDARPRDLEPGFRRGTARLTRLANSDGLREVAQEGFMHVLNSHGPGRLTSRTMPMAA